MASIFPEIDFNPWFEKKMQLLVYILDITTVHTPRMYQMNVEK